MIPGKATLGTQLQQLLLCLCLFILASVSVLCWCHWLIFHLLKIVFSYGFCFFISWITRCWICDFYPVGTE